MQYLEASLAFYPDRVELDQWNGKGLHVTIPYARVTAVLLTEDLLLIQGGQDVAFAAQADLPQGLLAYLAAKCPKARRKGF